MIKEILKKIDEKIPIDELLKDKDFQDFVIRLAGETAKSFGEGLASGAVHELNKI